MHNAFRAGLLAAAVSVSIPTLAAAQVFDPMRGYSFEGVPAATGAPEPGPAANNGPGRTRVRTRIHRTAPKAIVAASDRFRRTAANEGYRLTATPHREGAVFVAEALDDSGQKFQLSFNARGDITDHKAIDATAIAVAPTAPKTEEAKAQDTKPVEMKGAPSTIDEAIAEAPSAPTSDAIAAAKAEVAKAAAAEAEAKQFAASRAAESRHAQAKLAEAEEAARKAAQAKAIEERRQIAAAAEAKRNEARTAEVKRRQVAAAEAKLAQAKAIQARAEADLKQAEAQAAEARAAVAPAEMAKTDDKPTEMAPAEPSKTDAAKTAEAKPSETAASTDTAKMEPPKSADVPATATPDDSKPSPAEASKTDAAKAEETTPPSEAAKNEESAPTPAPTATAKAADPAASDTDMSPTGSTLQSPPEPYKAPTPDDAAAKN